jgi:hypothetical protein
MISIRRLIASMLAGALLVLVSAAQASAQPDTGLSLALEGVGRGLEAAAEVAGEGDLVVVDEAIIEALGVYDAWMAKHDDSNRQGEGQGPVNAQAVHEGLLEREVPGQLKKDTGSKLSGLSSVYDVLKGKSDEAKKIKEEKAATDKSNNGKSEDAKSNNGKSEDAKSNNGNSEDAKSDDDVSEDDE